MIDAEGLPMICAYCLIAAEGHPPGNSLMEEINPPEHTHMNVNSASDLVSRVDGRRLFRFFDRSHTTCMPVTVVNGTWVCVVHVRDSVMAWDRKRFG